MLNSYAFSLLDAQFLPYFAKLPFQNWIIPLQNYSWQGRIPVDLALEIAQLAKKEKKEAGQEQKKIAFQFDLPLNAQTEKSTLAVLDQLENFPLRVKDFGLAYWLKKNKPTTPFWVILGNQGKNLSSWRVLRKQFQEQLVGLVVSPEIPWHLLLEMMEELKTEDANLKIEILSAGKIPFFHSARVLLPEGEDFFYQSSEKTSAWQGMARSEKFGTQIFYERDLFLLDLLEDAFALKNIQFRVDCWKQEQWQALVQNLQKKEEQEKNSWALSLKKAWGYPLTQGFFYANKSDAQFRFLKNVSRNPQEEQKTKIGVVLEYVPNSHTLIQLDFPVNLPQTLFFFTPERLQISYSIKEATELASGKIFQNLEAGIFILPPIKKAIGSSSIFLEEKN